MVIPLALVATNIRFAASEVRVYDYSVREYNAAAAARIPESELTSANRKLVSYFTASNPGPLHVVVTNTNGEEETLFNARETAHLADVRDLFRVLFTVQIVAVALVLGLAVVLLASSPVRVLSQALLYGSVFTIGLIGATGALAFLGFEELWRQFHFLAFTNDFWRLNPNTDHLIQMFPEDFWFDISVLIGVFTVFQALLIGGASGLYLYLTRATAEGDWPRPRFTRRRTPEPRPRIPSPRPRHLTH